jgi:signal transduction histidine kinase
MAEARLAQAAPALPDAAQMFPPALEEPLAAFARLLKPHVGRLDVCFTRRLKGAPATRHYTTLQRKALFCITSGGAARLLAAGRPLADFFEQVAYNSRRLAKLNISPGEVVEALREYDRLADPLLANRYARQARAFEAAREQLHFCTVLAVNNAYYQVRESETQAFYGLLRAEMDAVSVEDLLRRFIGTLTRAFRAQAGRLIPILEPPQLEARLLKRLSRPRYIRAGSLEEELIVDAGMRGLYQSYWSIPFFSGARLAGVTQFGFPTPYNWLPRELDLLEAFAERCLRAAERTRLLQELAAREEQVRALAGHLMQAEEEERRRISRELHDEAGQSLLFLRLQLELLEKAAPPELQAWLGDARGVAEGIIVEIRRLIAALSPSVLEQLGLAAAVRQLSVRFRKLYALKLQLRLEPPKVRLPLQAEATLYRVVQECYQNIAKHSRASRVNVSLTSTDRSLELSIEDDGVGFDVDAAAEQRQSFGLKGMRERIALLGGRLEIRSRPGHGTAVVVQLPIPSPSGSSMEGEYGKNPNASDRRSHLVSAGN